jgi:CheY-like chemotaxis protein
MKPQQAVIVYVEDDEPSIFVMKMILERVMNLKNTYILRSSRDFMQQVKGLGVIPDLFLMDIQMKPHDGFELLSLLRRDQQFAQSKVVALTASVMNEQVARLKESGFDGAIAKPLNIDLFPQLIKNILNGGSVWYIS